MTLFRRMSGTATWFVVSGWSIAAEFDPGTVTRGVAYDYRLDTTVGGITQSSNIDSAMLFTDDPLVVGTTVVKRVHFDELRTAINALRASAALAPFDFDGTYASPTIRASHVTTMRTAINEARSALGMLTVTFTDPSLTGVTIKAAHIRELRDAAR
jgi:hypothetical protein